MKTNKMLLVTGIVLLLLASCTTDDLQPGTRKILPKAGRDALLMRMDSTSCNVSTIINDTISCGPETDPPPVKPSK